MNTEKHKVILFNGNNGCITEEYINFTNAETFGDGLRDLIFAENFKLHPQNKEKGRGITSIPYPFVDYVVKELITLKLNKDLNGFWMYGDDCGKLRRWDSGVFVKGSFGDTTQTEMLMGSLVLVGIKSMDLNGDRTFTDLEIEHKHYDVNGRNGDSYDSYTISTDFNDFIGGVK